MLEDDRRSYPEAVRDMFLGLLAAGTVEVTPSEREVNGVKVKGNIYTIKSVKDTYVYRVERDPNRLIPTITLLTVTLMHENGTSTFIEHNK